MAGICTVPRPRPVAWGSWAGISPPSIDLTDHGGGLVVAVGGRPRDAWAPLLRPPTHTGLRRSHGRSALGRWKVHGAPYVRLARLGPRSISPCFYGLARPSIGYRAGRLRRSPCQGSRFMVSIDGPEHNMYVSPFKLSICDRRAERTVKEQPDTVDRRDDNLFACDWVAPCSVGLRPPVPPPHRSSRSFYCPLQEA